MGFAERFSSYQGLCHIRLCSDPGIIKEGEYICSDIEAQEGFSGDEENYNFFQSDIVVVRQSK
jgi:hypothetical protein